MPPIISLTGEQRRAERQARRRAGLKTHTIHRGGLQRDTTLQQVANHLLLLAQHEATDAFYKKLMNISPAQLSFFEQHEGRRLFPGSSWLHLFHSDLDALRTLLRLENADIEVVRGYLGEMATMKGMPMAGIKVVIQSLKNEFSQNQRAIGILNQIESAIA